MMTLFAQITSDINARLERLNLEVTPQIANALERDMKQNTARGTAFGGDTYDATYTKEYQRKRDRAGVPTSPVTLRFKTKRIESTRVETTGAGSVISFDDPKMGVVFKYHHDGIDYARVGLRTRSIWPKTDDSVPIAIRELAQRLIGEVLFNGR
jgi:hypothetical protein